MAFGTLVNSQQRRALAVPVINRLSTACQPLVNRSLCSSIGLHSISLVRASRGTPRRSFFHRLGGKRVCFLLGEQSRRRRPVLPVPARPRRPAGRRPVPTRPGYVRVLDSTGKIIEQLEAELPDASETRPHVLCMYSAFQDRNIPELQ